jgi:hypothetical protein
VYHGILTFCQMSDLCLKLLNPSARCDLRIEQVEALGYKV